MTPPKGLLSSTDVLKGWRDSQELLTSKSVLSTWTQEGFASTDVLKSWRESQDYLTSKDVFGQTKDVFSSTDVLKGWRESQELLTSKDVLGISGQTKGLLSSTDVLKGWRESQDYFTSKDALGMWNAEFLQSADVIKAWRGTQEYLRSTVDLRDAWQSTREVVRNVTDVGLPEIQGWLNEQVSSFGEDFDYLAEAVEDVTGLNARSSGGLADRLRALSGSARPVVFVAAVQAIVAFAESIVSDAGIELSPQTVALVNALLLIAMWLALAESSDS